MHLVRQVYNKAPPSWFDRRCGGDGRGSDSGGGGGNSGEDNGGAVEEMDQDGSDVGGPSGRVYPADWTTKTKDQKKNIYIRDGGSMDLSRFAR